MSTSTYSTHAYHCQACALMSLYCQTFAQTVIDLGRWKIYITWTPVYRVLTERLKTNWWFLYLHTGTDFESGCIHGSIDTTTGTRKSAMWVVSVPLISNRKSEGILWIYMEGWFWLYTFTEYSIWSCSTMPFPRCSEHSGRTQPRTSGEFWTSHWIWTPSLESM